MKSSNLFHQAVLDKLGPALIKKEETLAVAESVTSGCLQLAISAIKDASRFFQGGITAYNGAQKYKHLHVEPIHANSTNCVSPRVAEQMAIHVCKLMQSHWGLAITGYATPVPESGNKTFAYYAIAHRGVIVEQGCLEPPMDETLAVQVSFTNSLCRRLLFLVSDGKDDDQDIDQQ